jgi:hypothetical protein
MLTITTRSAAESGYAELNEEEAIALAQLLKRVTVDDLRRNAQDDGEAYAMFAALTKLQTALAGAGYAPR